VYHKKKRHQHIFLPQKGSFKVEFKSQRPHENLEFKIVLYLEKMWRLCKKLYSNYCAENIMCIENKVGLY